MAAFEFTTIDKAVELTGMKAHTIRDNIAKGKFREDKEFFRVGRSIYLIIEGINQWVRNGGEQGSKLRLEVASRSTSDTKGNFA